MVSDEMVEKSFSVLMLAANGCPSLDLYSDECDATECSCRKIMRAAIEAVAPAIRAAAMEDAAKIAEGPEYQRDGNGEVTLRGTDSGNWSVPTTDFPRVGDYGQGRVDAAAAIRSAKETA